MKKKFSFLALLLAFVMAFAVACAPEDPGNNPGNDPSNDPTPPTYDTTDLVWGAQEVADTWTAGSAAGTAAMDGDIVKVQTMAGYGGVKSATFEMDFSKRVMINFKGYEDSNLTQLVVRIRFAGYSTVSTSGAYIIAENYDNLPNREMDYKYLNGDFSIDVSDAIFLYAGAPWYTGDDSCLIYQEGDIDDEGEEVLEGDPRIGHLKFEGQKVNGYIEIWCQPGTNSGLTAEDAYVGFEEISVTHEDAPAVTSFDKNQEDLVAPTGDAEDNRPTVGDEPLQLEPEITVASGKDAGIMYASTNPDAVSVDSTGKVSFNKATSSDVAVNLFPRANIAKVQTVKFSVLGNLKTPEAIAEHLNSLEYTDNKADITPDLNSLLDGTVLSAQPASFTGSVEGVQVYAHGNTMTVINAYDAANSAVKEAAEENGGKLTFSISKPAGSNLPDDNNWTYSVYTLTAGKVVKGVQDAALANGEGSVAFTYAENGIKVTDTANIIILWKNGTTSVASRLNVVVNDATEIAQVQTAKDIYDTATLYNGENNADLTYDADADVVKMGIKAKGGYDDLYAQLFSLDQLDFKNRNVVVVINIVEMVDVYVTFRWKGSDAEGNDVASFSNAYMHDVAGYAYNNMTEDRAEKTLTLEVWRYLNNRSDYITNGETVTSSGLRIQVVSFNSTATEAPFGYIAIGGITYYYVD